MKSIIGAIAVWSIVIVANCNVFMLGQEGNLRKPSNPSLSEPQRLSEKQIDNLLLAIQDEVYDYGVEKKFYRIGSTTGSGIGISTKIRVYIKPYLDKDGGGEMIYKDMPYGEVLRVFHFKSDRLAVLDNDPEMGFPITEPSHLTLFMDDEELCDDKMKWMHETVEIADTPSVSRVTDGAKRQQERVGFSAYFFGHTRKK